MRFSRLIPTFAVPLLLVACDAGPSEPTDLQLHSPLAGVRAPTEALPYWERGPLCCVDDYAVIYFYVTDPSVVPEDFNLLGFQFDFRALGAEFAVTGSNILANPGDFVPRKVSLHGIAPVPFWFIPTAILDEVADDGFVSVSELDREEVVVGFASHFVEELHPSGGTAKQPRLTATARGTLVGGGTFQFTFAEHVNPITGKATELVNGSLTFD